MRVLFLDTATKTGWCVTENGRVIAHGLLRLDAKVGKDSAGNFQRQPAILCEAYARFQELLAEHQPDFVVAEIPHLRGASSFLTVAIYGIAEMATYECKAGFYGVHTATWQSRIIPKPKGEKAKKGDTKKRAEAHVLEMGFEVETDDVADAICIAEYTHNFMRLGGQSIPFIPANDNVSSPRRAA